MNLQIINMFKINSENKIFIFLTYIKIKMDNSLDKLMKNVYLKYSRLNKNPF